MKIYLLLPTIMFSLFSCKQNSDKFEVKNLTDDSQQLQNLETCYEAVHGQDSVKLSVIYSAGNITGSLLYNNPQSENSSTETFTGTKSGDTFPVKQLAERLITMKFIF